MSELGERGQRLLAALVARDKTLDDPANPLREVALSACATADRVARLEDLAVDVEPWVETDRGALVTHPVLVEVRQQATLLSRLVAALRLPDEKTGKRPQHRPLRGVHAPAPISSLERARQRAEGH